jgi:hypothetical protein
MQGFGIDEKGIPLSRGMRLAPLFQQGLMAREILYLAGL